MAAGHCPWCDVPRERWPNPKRRSRCCCKDCTAHFNAEMHVWGWGDMRYRVFKRDNWTCVKCGARPMAKVAWDPKGPPDNDTSKLVADHIRPIALGGPQWDMANIQTLCADCNRTKTAQDAADIAAARAVERVEAYDARVGHKQAKIDVF